MKCQSFLNRYISKLLSRSNLLVSVLFSVWSTFSFIYLCTQQSKFAPLLWYEGRDTHTGNCNTFPFSTLNNAVNHVIVLTLFLLSTSFLHSPPFPWACIRLKEKEIKIAPSVPSSVLLRQKEFIFDRKDLPLPRPRPPPFSKVVNKQW